MYETFDDYVLKRLIIIIITIIIIIRYVQRYVVRCMQAERR